MSRKDIVYFSSLCAFFCYFYVRIGESVSVRCCRVGITPDSQGHLIGEDAYGISTYFFLLRRCVFSLVVHPGGVWFSGSPIVCFLCESNEKKKKRGEGDVILFFLPFDNYSNHHDHYSNNRSNNAQDWQVKQWHCI